MSNNMPKVIVKCPKCGAEYTLEEIFYPSTIMGRPKDLVRDPLNHIIYCGWEGEEPTYKEDYTCDYCGHTFTAEAKITVTIEEKPEELDFSELTVKLF